MHQLAREVDPPQKAKDTWPNFQMSQQNDNDMLQLQWNNPPEMLHKMWQI